MVEETQTITQARCWCVYISKDQKIFTPFAFNWVMDCLSSSEHPYEWPNNLNETPIYIMAQEQVLSFPWSYSSSDPSTSLQLNDKFHRKESINYRQIIKHKSEKEKMIRNNVRNFTTTISYSNMYGIIIHITQINGCQPIRA